MTDPNDFSNQGGFDSEKDQGGAQEQYEGEKIDALMSWDSGQDNNTQTEIEFLQD